ncbi:MAG: (2Fe-2S)-binding protein [Pirellulaceae bacterium]
MELDEDVCVCFHVSKRKVLNFLRVQQPKRAGQLADCFGAGTGCGWCRPFLQTLFRQSQVGPAEPPALPAAEDYGIQREAHLRAGRGTPPPTPPAPDGVGERPTGD